MARAAGVRVPADIEAVSVQRLKQFPPGMYASMYHDIAKGGPLEVDGLSGYIVREGRAFATVVRVGSRKEGFVTILTDLRAGDTVVLSPSVDLRDGTRVE